jgi:hypothetical protein
MAYKYFTQQLINKNVLDLSSVFPEKQKIAQDRSQVSYNLGDVVVYLKDITDDFKITDNKYIDLDNAIREIIVKYYKSIGIEKNPITSGIDDEAVKELDKTSATEAYIVEDGKLKGKGVAKSAPKKEEKVSSKKEEVVVKKINVTDKISQFKKELEKRQDIIDTVYDDQEKAEFIELMKKKLSADEIFAEDGDEYFIQRVEILKDFINKNS